MHDQKKTCMWCRRLLPFGKFHNDRGRPDGKNPRCGECSNFVKMMVGWARRQGMSAAGIKHMADCAIAAIRVQQWSATDREACAREARNV